mmetsp:Transcript_36265/g.102495  ORF Transcript_36265/g.102495 Transcript_36265/m.102495 type:complete len:205 (+) Transcript_36265:133-747(+)
MHDVLPANTGLDRHPLGVGVAHMHQAVLRLDDGRVGVGRPVAAAIWRLPDALQAGDPLPAASIVGRDVQAEGGPAWPAGASCVCGGVGGQQQAPVRQLDTVEAAVWVGQLCGGGLVPGDAAAVGGGYHHPALDVLPILCGAVISAQEHTDLVVVPNEHGALDNVALEGHVGASPPCGSVISAVLGVGRPSWKPTIALIAGRRQN